MGIELDKYQLDAIEALRPGNILVGGTGSGKSRTSLAYYFLKICGGGIEINGEGELKEMTTPVDLYVITTAKKRDTLEWSFEASDWLISENPENSISGVRLTVDSWNNIKKYTDVEDAFFIFDEQRLVGSGAWVKSFYRIAKFNRWILLSATPGDTWSDYIPVFVANGFYRNKTEFNREHVIFSNYAGFPKIEKYYSTSRLERYRRAITIRMEIPRHTNRKRVYEVCSYDKEKWDRIVKDRWNIWEDAPIVNSSELFVCMRRLVNSDNSRQEALSAILAANKKVIIYYNFDYELDALRALLGRSERYFREWNGHNHHPLPDTDEWVYLVQYSAGAEAWNCITTDTMVFYSLNYSYRLTHQCEGRIDRRNTPYKTLYYHYLRSPAPIDIAIMRALQLKKDFNEREFERNL